MVACDAGTGSGESGAGYGTELEVHFVRRRWACTRPSRGPTTGCSAGMAWVKALHVAAHRGDEGAHAARGDDVLVELAPSRRPRAAGTCSNSRRRRGGRRLDPVRRCLRRGAARSWGRGRSARSSRRRWRNRARSWRSPGRRRRCVPQVPPQSTSLSVPFLTPSLQVGAAQVSSAAQIPSVQSVPSAQLAPSAHRVGHDPPQSTSLSLPSFLPSVQLGGEGALPAVRAPPSAPLGWSIGVMPAAPEVPEPVAASPSFEPARHPLASAARRTSRAK